MARFKRRDIFIARLKLTLLSTYWWRGWLPTVARGYASWCGRYTIIHAPRHISRMSGHGSHGLELWRRLHG